ncbi:MAG: hypothetical protein HC800_01095 [Phormidesmis sp. RL_2_1]|nr:hypothetical protein [Phormidesmis sp. RL_2_1]
MQDLDIPVEYTPVLPVIDEVFEKLQSPEILDPKLPAAFEKALLEKAALLWEDAPWQHLSEQEILAIELNRWEIETLYLSVLGLAGLEYGLLFYRDLESLQQFRHKLLNSQDFSDDMQQAFLEQNCLFINFNPAEDVIAMPLEGKAAIVDNTAVEYEFGSLHPLEGLRSQLAEEEAASLVVVLEALHRFFKKHDLSTDKFALKPASSRFRIPNPAKASLHTSPLEIDPGPDKIAVKVSDGACVSATFLAETFDADIDYSAASDGKTAFNTAPLISDSVPDGSFIMLGNHTDKKLAPLRDNPRIYYQSFIHPPQKRPTAKASWPILTIQTSRPKAQKLLAQLRREGGIRAICFNPGTDPLSGQFFQVGLLETELGHLHLFNEYELNNPIDGHSLEKWAEGTAQNDGCCGCIIATGATGIHQGRPTIKEIVGFFELQAKQPDELGLAPLMMSYDPE